MGDRAIPGLHVAFVCNELPPAPSGGIGAHVAVMAAALARQGHRVTVVGAYEAVHAWADDGYHVVRVDPALGRLDRIWLRLAAAWPSQRGRAEYLREALTRRRIWRALRKVHSANPIDMIEYPSYMGMYFKSIRGASALLHVHGAEVLLGRDKSDAYVLAETESARGLETWIGPSRWALEALSKACAAEPRLAVVIPNPVDVRMFRPRGEARPEQTVLFVGRLSEHKGDVRLAAAADRFLGEFPGARLRYLGNDAHGRAAEILSRVAPRFRDRASVEGARTRAEVAAAMSASAILALPSRSETFSNVCAEAMACGLPVVAGDNSGMREVVIDGESGFLVDAEDVAALGERICRLLRQAELRARMGAEGRRIALARYALDAVVDQTIRFYREVLTQPPLLRPR